MTIIEKHQENSKGGITSRWLIFISSLHRWQTEGIKENAGHIAKQNGISIELRNSRAFRKEERIAEIIKEGGTEKGWCLSVLELSDTYKPWHDRDAGQYYFKKDQTKCLHYYFYFIDQEFGPCFLKVPAIAPYRATFYCNGHNWLEHTLIKDTIAYQKEDGVHSSPAPGCPWLSGHDRQSPIPHWRSYSIYHYYIIL